MLKYGEPLSNFAFNFNLRRYSEAALTEGNDNFARNLYYDVGAVAIAFAVNRANSSSAKFWTSKTEGTGFWAGRCRLIPG